MKKVNFKQEKLNSFDELAEVKKEISVAKKTALLMVMKNVHDNGEDFEESLKQFIKDCAKKSNGRYTEADVAKSIMATIEEIDADMAEGDYEEDEKGDK